MPAYEGQNFDPPAPVALVTIRHPERAELVATATMLIDTGADATLIPRAIIEALGISSTGERFALIAFNGTPTQADTARVHLLFLGKIFRGNHLLIDDAIGVLGRNILQHVRLQLDGPAARWEEWL